MKKIQSIFLIAILIFSTCVVINSSAKNTIMQEKKTASFSQLTFKEYKNSFQIVLEGSNTHFLKKDYYIIPSRIETVTFPFKTQIKSVRCIPYDIQTRVLTKKLEVTPDPILVSQAVSIKDQKSAISNSYLSINSWYTYDVGIGIIDNQRKTIVKVQEFPIQYRPDIDQIQWAKKMDIIIEYILPEYIAPLALDDQYTYIILTSAEFTSVLQNLVTHKNSRNITTKLVTLDDVYSGVYFPVQGYDEQEKIKYFIKSAIEQWGTSYVLLVGGDSEFPARVTHVQVEDVDKEEFVSDLYYADIYNETGGFCSWDSNGNHIYGEYTWGSSHLTDEVDLNPDVYLSRLAATSTSQVTTCVNKIITYENDRAYTQDWFSTLITAGGDSFTNDPDYGDTSGVDEGEYANEAVIDIMDGFIPDRIWATNGRLSGIVPTGVAEISDAINTGAGFIDFSGHGNPQVWSTHPHNSSKSLWIPTPKGKFDTTNVGSLTNGNKLPIVVTGACSVSKYNSISNCFSWSFLTNENGGGIGSFGATGLGWAYIGKDVTQGLIEAMAINVFKAYKEEGATTFGELWGKAVLLYIKPQMEAVDYKTIEEWQSLGDPTLAVAEKSQPPVKPGNLNGPTQGKINQEHTYTVSTTDPESDELYYLFNWGDNQYSGWVGPYNSGETAQASHTWTKKGDYQIQVKAKDEHGVQSEWSDPLPISMAKLKVVFNERLIDIFQKLIDRFPVLKLLGANLILFLMN